MEKLLALMLDEIRGLVSVYQRDPGYVVRLWSEGFFPSGTQWRSVKAAMQSQIQARLGGRILEGMSGDVTLNRWDYAFNPAMDSKFRYTARAECQNVEGGPSFSTLLTVPSATELTADQIHADFTQQLSMAVAQGSFTSPPGQIEPHATCTYEILFAERSTR